MLCRSNKLDRLQFVAFRLLNLSRSKNHKSSSQTKNRGKKSKIVGIVQSMQTWMNEYYSRIGFFFSLDSPAEIQLSQTILSINELQTSEMIFIDKMKNRKKNTQLHNIYRFFLLSVSLHVAEKVKEEEGEEGKNGKQHKWICRSSIS